MSKKPQYPEIASELKERFQTDQEMRLNSKEKGWDDSVDISNRERLKEIIKEMGWPTKSKVGEDGAIAAWCIAQHADLDPVFQQECLTLMKDSPEGEVRKQDLAYLEDRVRVNTNRPTLYGTQFYTNEAGVYGPRPIEKIEGLNERRSSVGLEPFEQRMQGKF